MGSDSPGNGPQTLAQSEEGTQLFVSSSWPPPVSPYFSLLFLVYLLLLLWGALTPIFVSASLFSLSNLICLSLLLSLVPSWPLLSGGYECGSPHSPEHVSPVGVFCEVSLLQGSSIPPPCHTIPASLGRHLPVWVKLGMSARMCVCMRR